MPSDTPILDHAASVPSARKAAKTPWLRRLGWVGFFFFLTKGLLWLIVPSLLVLWKSIG